MRNYQTINHSNETFNDYVATKSGKIGRIKKDGSVKWLKMSELVYRTVDIRGKTRAVHRIIAETFIPKPAPNYEVNHKNGDEWDNRVSNLEWTDRRGNIVHYWSKLVDKKYSDKNLFKLFKMRDVNNLKWREISSKLDMPMGSLINIYKGRKRPYLRQQWINR